MDYAQRQRQPGKHVTGITVVVVLHIVLGYALVSGLARKVVDVIKQPLETKIIEEVKKPPPPDTPPPPPPKMVQVMPTFVPPPEVQVQAPVVQAPIVSVTNVAPPVYAPPAPPAPANTGPVNAAVACSNIREVKSEIKYPPQAAKDGLQGTVSLTFKISPTGEVKDVEVKSSTNRIFNSASVSAARKLKCAGQGRVVPVTWDVGFTLAD